MRSILLVLALIGSAFGLGKRHQNITVTGVALCNGKPLNNMVVDLKEKDYFSKDDILMSTSTDRRGEFELYGEDNEMFDIKPYLVFHHNCTALPNCFTETSYDVPGQFLNSHYNMTVDLANHEEGNKSKC